MTRALVLGSGMVGSVIAADLCAEAGWAVTVADVSEASLAKTKERTGGKASVVEADLSKSEEIARLAKDADIVVGALPSRFGFMALKTAIEAGKNYCDISFMPEEALDLHELAKARGVMCVVDMGVAPGMSNLLAAFLAQYLDPCEEISIMVGGLPRERRWPFEYKAGFSPLDVIEEYTRPSRIVEHGKVVVRPALSEPELVDLPGVGTVEAFNTDGLRSIVRTMKVPTMKEKTLRYPGHIELMRVFRETGLFSQEAIEVRDVEGKMVRVRPLDVTSKLLFPKWTYESGEEDLTVMRVSATGIGRESGRREQSTIDLLDFYDRASGFTSMSRTTAYPCTIMARCIVSGMFNRRGVFAPEQLGGDVAFVTEMLGQLAKRGVRYSSVSREALASGGAEKDSLEGTS